MCFNLFDVPSYPCEQGGLIRASIMLLRIGIDGIHQSLVSSNLVLYVGMSDNHNDIICSSPVSLPWVSRH